MHLVVHIYFINFRSVNSFLALLTLILINLKLSISVFGFVFCYPDVSAAQISCRVDELQPCTEQIQGYLDRGVAILKGANDTVIGLVCG